MITDTKPDLCTVFVERTDVMAETRIVAGLGNPGRKYVGTRHNMGFMVVDLLAEALDIEVSSRKFGARFGRGQASDERKMILLKPWQFMNCSGEPIAHAVAFYKIALSNLLVVSDDMALEPGRIRLRAAGSSGGHNGLADVTDELGTADFSRLRIGIGQSDSQDAYDYVLSRPSAEQKTLLEQATEQAKEAVLCWAEHGIATAMNRFNEK